MLKRLISISILSIMVLVSSLTAFANDPVSDLINKGVGDPTKQFLVTITRPEGDEFTFKKNYVISGITERKDMRVKLFIYNSEEKKYVPFVTTDGVTSWDVGSSGVFMKEVVLPNDGTANKIAIAAYNKNTDTSDLKADVNFQRNYFTVTLLNSNTKDSFKNGIFGFKGIL